MDFSCKNIDQIKNPGLKRLYSIRCNRFKASNHKPVISTEIDTNINYNLLYLLLLVFMFVILIFLSGQKNIDKR